MIILTRRNALCLAFIFAAPVMAASNSDSLLSNQASAMDSTLSSDAAACAAGDTPGTIGYAIKDAINAHTALAAATPQVESLFDVDSNCFSGASSIFDLSFAIPSVGSIVSSAQDAVVKFAQKKVCSAVSQVSSMVTSPINDAIKQVKGYSSFADSAVGGGLSNIDPNLGSQYHNGNSTNYSVDVNPFNTTQSSVTTPATSSVNNASVSNTSSTNTTSSSEPSSYISSLGGLIK